MRNSSHNLFLKNSRKCPFAFEKFPFLSVLINDQIWPKTSILTFDFELPYQIIILIKVCVFDLVQLEDDIGYFKSSHTDLLFSNWTRSKTQTLSSKFLFKNKISHIQLGNEKSIINTQCFIRTFHKYGFDKDLKSHGHGQEVSETKPDTFTRHQQKTKKMGRKGVFQCFQFGLYICEW